MAWTLFALCVAVLLTFCASAAGSVRLLEAGVLSAFVGVVLITAGR